MKFHRNLDRVVRGDGLDGGGVVLACAIVEGLPRGDGLGWVVVCACDGLCGGADRCEW